MKTTKERAKELVERILFAHVDGEIFENMYKVAESYLTEQKYEKIPSKYRLGGMDMEVRMVERCNEDHAGECFLCSGYMEIAEKFNRDDRQSESCKINTFYHELTHSILQTMGEYELNENEKFVNCFAGFLADAMDKAYFKEEE